MNIAIIGNSYFGPILTKQLSDFDKKNSYKFYNTNEKLIDKIKFAINIPFIDIVYSISASISGGGALNLALKFNKKIVQHFIGSDVLSAQNDFKHKRINKELIRNSEYLCEAEWIKDELKELNIYAKIVPYKAHEEFLIPKKFGNFSVLTYLGKDKEEYYGINDFIKLAIDFPQIKFKIAGIVRYKDLPQNIKCLGWVDLNEEMQKSTVYIRNAKHDGLAFSVIEALALGRYVARNYNFPFVDYFKNYEELKKIIIDKYIDFQKGELDINYKAIEFIENNFNKSKVLSNIVKILEENL